MTLNDLFEALCEQLNEDTNNKNSELFNNKEVIQFKRVTAIRKHEAANLVINPYLARLTLKNDSIECDFRHIHDSVDFYIITINGEQIIVSDPHIPQFTRVYDVPKLSKWIIDRLLEVIEKQL